MSTLSSIAVWHRKARPVATDSSFNTQLGCHVEEIVEMFDALTSDDEDLNVHIKITVDYLNMLSLIMKTNASAMKIKDRNAFLDSLGDQVVTAIGVGHCSKVDVVKALGRIDVSNWSKFDNRGEPIFDENGKVMKGPNYLPPTLEGLY